MIVSMNQHPYRYDLDNKCTWSLLPSLFKKKGVNVLAIGFKELYKFYFKYLKFKPDLIEVCWVPAACIPLLFKKLGLIKCPIVHRWDDYYADMQTKYPRFIIRWMEDFVVKNADYNVSISKYNVERGKRFNRQVIYIQPGYFKGDKQTKINLDKLKTNKKNITFAYLGDQSPYKRVDKIIEAVRDLPCDLFLIGNPNEDLKKKAGKNVHFIGYVDELEVKSLMKQADVLVNTSDQDCNYKIFEYVAAGRPILGYKGRIGFVFKNRRDALLVDDFREGVKELIKDKKLRNSLEKNIRRFETPTWSEIADKYIRYYKKWALKN